MTFLKIFEINPFRIARNASPRQITTPLRVENLTNPRKVLFVDIKEKFGRGGVMLKL